MEKLALIAQGWKIRILTFFSIFGPATIVAVADNDANGVATYALAGAQLGYPILFVLLWVTVLLAITQEMGARLTIVTRKGLGDLIREKYGVRYAVPIFITIAVANLILIVVNVVSLKVTASLLGLPAIPLIVVTLVLTYMLVVKGSFTIVQNLVLFSCLLYFAYIYSAFKTSPDWGSALSNLVYPNGVVFDGAYIRNYIITGLAVIGTTITPWGQFFISSFSLDKKIDAMRLRYAQVETYWGAFLTNFFSFFMIVATAATLFLHQLPLTSGDQAATAIEPFAGRLASIFFAIGIMNAAFIGIFAIALSTTYAFSEFFGFSRSLDSSFNKSRQFYGLFGIQLVVAGIIGLLPNLDLFSIAIAAQILSSLALPIIFFYLIRFTSSRKVMGEHANSSLQNWIAIIGTFLITCAAVFTVVAAIFGA